MESVSLRDFVDTKKCSKDLNLSNLRQPSYVCLTCLDHRLVCRACRHEQKHFGHNMCSLGRRRFVCESDGFQNQQIPTHNREGRFCWCEREYSDDSAMWQCLSCEDWFHLECIQQDLAWITSDSEGDFVCRNCAAKFPFAECANNQKLSSTSSTMQLSILLPSDWQPCSCNLCTEKLAPLFSSQCVELDESSEGELDVDELDKLDKTAVLRTLEGYNALKAQLTAFLQSMPPGHVITQQDIYSIFQGTQNRKTFI